MFPSDILFITMTLISAPLAPGMADRVSLMAASTTHCWPVTVSLMTFWLEIPTFPNMSLSSRSSWILPPPSSLEKVRLLWEFAKYVHLLWIIAMQWIYSVCILISILSYFIFIYFLFFWFVTNILIFIKRIKNKLKSNQIKTNHHNQEHKHKPKNTNHPIVT